MYVSWRGCARRYNTFSGTNRIVTVPTDTRTRMTSKNLSDAASELLAGGWAALARNLLKKLTNCPTPNLPQSWLIGWRLSRTRRQRVLCDAIHCVSPHLKSWPLPGLQHSRLLR